MAKVKWQAKHEYEYVENFKILQQAFAKNDMKRYIDVDKLIKAKYQDNLEFLQWMKRYHDINFNGEPYDAVGRRKGQDLFYILGGGKVAAGGAQPHAAPKLQPKTTVAKAAGSAVGSKAAGAKTIGGGAAKAAGKGDPNLQAELSEMKLNMDTLEKERDFYFGKLRDIEMLMQAN